MHVKKIKEKLVSLSKLMKIVESKKNITLIDILKLSKKISIYYERAIQTKHVIESILENHNVDSPLLNSNKLLNNQFAVLKKLNNKHTNKTIWVYITEEEKYSTNSYFKQEKHLSSVFKEEDLIIAIGERAIRFAKSANYNILFSAQKNDVEILSTILPSLIENYYQTYGFHDLKFILNSSKIKNNHLDVLPMKNLNFNLNVKSLKFEKAIDVQKMKIYPDVKEFVEAELVGYLTYIFYTLLNESSLIYLKYKLVAQNQKINDLEKKYKQMNLHMLRGKRELEVEELSLLSKKKDLLHERKEK
ncbi:MSC_0622 family F1-like ATPase gamma subunit [Mycoplasmopsis glycophila]|uniref:ATP synthase gamma chain n=1 Tax=Mycoplasmopsis glycophila TaxID=171285 RepID=A0A449AUQ2_9BACT|nr:hypothetical protein [Mycoplasmopsis glycophila]VEU70202.1 Uncharacterised protein [Mycoplasmopsis glycophila]